jgi:hypothetical protein
MRFASVLLAGILIWTPAQSNHRWGVQLKSMRCGRSLVTVGDDAYLLLDRCGDPDYRNTVRLIKLSDQLSGLNGDIIQSVEDSTFLVSEEWVYKRGRGRLTRILTVTGGILADIRLSRRQ